MNWTSALPTQPGWYFWKSNLHLGPFPVKVISGGDVLKVEGVAFDCPVHSWPASYTSGVKWWGPLDIPV